MRKLSFIIVTAVIVNMLSFIRFLAQVRDKSNTCAASGCPL